MRHPRCRMPKTPEKGAFVTFDAPIIGKSSPHAAARRHPYTISSDENAGSAGKQHALPGASAHHPPDVPGSHLTDARTHNTDRPQATYKEGSPHTTGFPSNFAFILEKQYAIHPEASHTRHVHRQPTTPQERMYLKYGCMSNRGKRDWGILKRPAKSTGNCIY